MLIGMRVGFAWEPQKDTEYTEGERGGELKCRNAEIAGGLGEKLLVDHKGTKAQS